MKDGLAERAIESQESPREALYSIPEEVAHSVLHGIGLALSIAGLVVLVVLASLRGTAWHIVSCSVYGATLVILYGSSTLYHGIQSPKAKRVLRVLDHSSIYLLIAGTYTPVTLIGLRGGWGWSLFGVIWGLALTGVALKPFLLDRFRILSPILYILMGWLAIIAIKPLLASIPIYVLVWIGLGGVAYTVGVLFYAIDGKVPYNHAIWHLFVMAGSIFHYIAIFFLIPPKA
jgi:hemolysin III